MTFISYFSVLTNGLVIAFSSNFIPRQVWIYAHGGRFDFALLSAFIHSFFFCLVLASVGTLLTCPAV